MTVSKILEAYSVLMQIVVQDFLKWTIQI